MLPPSASWSWMSVHLLPNGNMVVADPGYSLPGPEPVANAGAVHLIDGVTLRPLGMITGSAADDRVGEGGIVALPNGGFLILSPQWANGPARNAGAVTWCSGAGPLPAVVSPDNSLVGSSPGDSVGGTLSTGDTVVLTNGDYVVGSPGWDHGGIRDAGAVTWCGGAAGRAGVVSAANSLVGGAENDQVGGAPEGGGVIPLENGNYVVASPHWDNGAAADAGAVTWGDGAQGRTGPVSTANSLTGAYPRDQVGGGGKERPAIVRLGNGNYLVRSPEWDGGRGAVTWASGSAGIAGEVSAANSLVGTRRATTIATGVGGVNYVVASPDWNESRGAATWGGGAAGVSGEISAVNSLVGDSPGDRVGIGGIVVVGHGNYVVRSHHWDRAAAPHAAEGAVTWGSGAAGVAGEVSELNSLVGTSRGDLVGDGGVTVLANGNYVVNSTHWGNRAGAVTWGGAEKGVSGPVSSANSLTGGSPSDRVELETGSLVLPLANGHYVVSDPRWGDAAKYQAGSVTWCSGTQGRTGTVTAENSMLGASTEDRIGSGGITALANGDFTVSSPWWGGRRGAVTWCGGGGTLTGAVSAANSLHGTSDYDFVGLNGVIALPGGNYLVLIPGWSGSLGAITWGHGAGGTTGPVSPENSLTGTGRAGRVLNHSWWGVTILTNGNYVIGNPAWSHGRGSVTWGSGSMGVRGEISEANSLVGVEAQAELAVAVHALSGGGYLMDGTHAPPFQNRLLLGDGWSGTRGTVSEADGLSLPAQSGPVIYNWSLLFDSAHSRLVAWNGLTRQLSLFGTMPEMAVRSGARTGTGIISGTGNAPVPHGQTAPQAGNGTDFGPATAARDSVERVFTILNTGMEPLRLTGSPPVTVDGPHAADFTVSALAPALPASGALAPAGGAAEFRITFKPSAPGPRRAVVSIPNDDHDESPYTFAVQGLGLDPDGPGGGGDGVLADWRAHYFGNASAGTGSLEDFDSDGVANLLEFAFGTHPAAGGGGGGGAGGGEGEEGDAGAGSGPDALRYTGSLTGEGGGGTLVSTGQPVMARLEDGSLTALFIRRKDRAEAGLDYQPQFTTDPAAAAAVWTAITAQPAVLAENGPHEVVSVPLPAPAGGRKGAGFFRVRVVEG